MEALSGCAWEGQAEIAQKAGLPFVSVLPPQSPPDNVPSLRDTTLSRIWGWGSTQGSWVSPVGCFHA